MKTEGERNITKNVNLHNFWTGFERMVDRSWNLSSQTALSFGSQSSQSAARPAHNCLQSEMTKAHDANGLL